MMVLDFSWGQINNFKNIHWHGEQYMKNFECMLKLQDQNDMG